MTGFDDPCSEATTSAETHNHSSKQGVLKPEKTAPKKLQVFCILASLTKRVLEFRKDGLITNCVFSILKYVYGSFS